MNIVKEREEMLARLHAAMHWEPKLKRSGINGSPCSPPACLIVCRTPDASSHKYSVGWAYVARRTATTLSNTGRHATLTSWRSSRRGHTPQWVFIQIAKKTHPKTLSSKITFIQKHFHPKTLSSKTISSKTEDTFIQKRFHPMTLSSKTIFIPNPKH